MKVQVRGLHKRFGKTVAVDNFTFSFDNGHVFGQKWPENQFVAIGDGFGGRDACAGGRIIGGDAQVGRIGIEQGHGRGIGDRLADSAAGTAHRDEQGDAVASGIGWQNIGVGRFFGGFRSGGNAAFGNDRTAGQQCQRADGEAFDNPAA